MKNIFLVAGLLLMCVQALNAQSQVMREIQNNPRVDANTRVRALNTLMDSLQTALSLPKREIMPEEKVGSRGYARLDQRALAASFQDMVEALGLDIVVPEPPINPREVLTLTLSVFEAAQNQPPSVQTYVATEIESMLATIQGAVTNDGRKTLDAWGFKFGTDSTLTDSILVPFDSIPFGAGHYGNFLDTSAVDTGAFYSIQRSLIPSSTYYFSAWGENEVGIAHGDTLSFVTKLGVTVEKAFDVTDSTGTIQASFTYGDVVPTSVGLKWSQNADLSAATDSVIALGADSTIAWTLTGLSQDSTYYFVGYGTNIAGTTFGDTLSFEAAFDPCDGMESVTYNDYDYQLVAIGTNCWFAENLRSLNYANGEAIPGNLSDSEWTATTSGAQAIYANENANLPTYGRLYNWYAVADSRGLCPSGWHVPTDAEWTELTDVLGGLSVAGSAMKSSSTDSPGWDGTNTSGFSALPGGLRSFNNGLFYFKESSAFWWSASQQSESFVWFRALYSSDDDVNVDRSSGSPKAGFSIRCLKDAESSSANVPEVLSSAASDLAETSATLNGEVTSDGGDAVTATGFIWGTESNLSASSDAAGSGTSGTFTASLTGLTGGTTYYFSAYATNGEGTAYGDTLSFTTEPAAASFTCGTSTVPFDGHAYNTVEIGSQCWFAENLRSTQYADGTSIPEVTDGSTWAGLSSGALSAYENDATKLSTYGYMYNWYAVNNAAGLCPTGWHVPTDAEWTTLTTHLGGESVAGAKMKSASDDTPSWDGTNTSGFSGLPGGVRWSGNGSFGQEGGAGLWWSSTMDATLDVFDREIGSGSATVYREYYGPRTGMSVRCLKDE